MLWWNLIVIPTLYQWTTSWSSQLGQLLRDDSLLLDAVISLTVLHAFLLGLDHGRLDCGDILWNFHEGGQVASGLVDFSQLVLFENYEGAVSIGGGNCQHFASAPGEVSECCIMVVAHAKQGLHFFCAVDQQCWRSGHCVYHVVVLLE